MPSTSKAQQRLMGQAYAIKKGDMKPSELDSEYRDEIVKLADSMSLADLKDFAETSYEGLPDTANESYTPIPTFDVFVNELHINEQQLNEAKGKASKLMKRLENKLIDAAKISKEIYDHANAGDKENVDQYSGTEGNDLSKWMKYVWNAFSTGDELDDSQSDEIFKK